MSSALEFLHHQSYNKVAYPARARRTLQPPTRTIHRYHRMSSEKPSSSQLCRLLASTHVSMPPCRLPLFPAELRIVIYELVLAETDPVDITSAGVQQPPLLLACQTLRRESLPIYYKLNSFQVEANHLDVEIHRIWVVHTRSLSVEPEIIAHTLLPWMPNWLDLERWLQLYYSGEVYCRMIDPAEHPLTKTRRREDNLLRLRLRNNC